MKLHTFRSRLADHYGFDPDRSGRNLPADGAPWVYLKTTDFRDDDPPRIGASSQVILSGVRERGFHTVQVKVSFTKGPARFPATPATPMG